MPIPVTVQGAGLTASLLLFRAYGARVASVSVLSAMLAGTIALNPGLAALSAELPVGTSPLLPDLDTARPVPKRAAVSLFGD